jgi:hypothetical protein
MRRSLWMVVLAAALIVTTSLPASAASWLHLRINPGNGTWKDTKAVQFSDLPVDFNVAMLGATGFLQFPNSRFGLRFNIDYSTLTSFTGNAFLIYSSGSWRYYDISVGFPIMLGQVRTLLFAGYGNHRADFASGGPVITRQDSGGLVFGADLWYPFGSQQQWYLAGSATIGPSMTYTYTNNPPDTPRASGRSFSGVYSVGIGYMLPSQTGNIMTAIEAGWRSGGFAVSSISSGDAAVDGQDVRWQGIYVGLKLRGK